MDEKTTIQELKELVLRFRDERDWKQFHNPKDCSIALTIEAAELLDHFRFKSLEEIKEYLSDPKNKKEVSYELADTLWFVLILAEELGVDLASALNEKVLLSAKKYPVELVKGKNKKYSEYVK